MASTTASTMARTVSCGGETVAVMIGSLREVSPSALLALVLLLEPAAQRREVLEDRRRVHLARAGQLVERVLPGLARALGEHRAELAAGGLVAVDRALRQRALEAGRVAQGLLELELDDERQEVPGVRDVAGHVVLGPRVEVGLGPRDRGGDALVLLAELPPRGVVVLRRDFAREH